MNPAARHQLTRARRRRQDETAFAGLIQAPASGSVTLPANGRFAFVASVDNLEGDPVADLAGPSDVAITSPGMTADQYLVLDHAEKDTVVTVHTGFNMVLVDGMGRHSTICEGV